LNSKIAGRIASVTESNKVALIILAIVLVTLMVDVSLARVYDLINKEPTSSSRIVVFVVLTSICIGAQLFLLQYAANKSTQIRNVARLRTRTIHHAVRISQIAIAALLVTLMLQTALTQYYNSMVLISVLWASHATGIVLIGLLAKRFLSWFSANKNYVILMYALAAATIAANMGFTILYVSDILTDRPSEIGPYSAGSMVLIPRNSLTAIYNSGFFVTSIVAFAILWISTAMLLHHKAPVLGKLRFWTTIGSPLILFLAQFASYFGQMLNPFLVSDPVTLTLWVTLIFTLSKPIGGILFGVAFYTIARKFHNDIALRNYLIISALGFVLLFASNQASVLLVAPYPPYGIATASFTGLASYFVVLGIYSSAISLSQDSNLRHIVRRKVEDQSGMLDTIGTAHMSEEIERKVISVFKANSEKLMEATGLEVKESEENVKLYINEVIAELKAAKLRDADGPR
jgi:hypothetical protein